MFNKKELRSLLFGVLLLTLIFAFDDGSETFFFGSWLANFAKVFIFAAITLFTVVVVQKWVASIYDIQGTFKFWHIRQFWFSPSSKLKRPLPFGPILSLFVTFFSNGQLFFTAFNTLDLKEKISRIGRKYVVLSEFEEGLICLSGTFANLFLIILFNFFSNITGINFSLIINMNLIFAFLSLIPIPPLVGGRIFMGSRLLYVFSLVFVLLAATLRIVPFYLDIILSLLIGSLVLLVYYYKWEK